VGRGSGVHHAATPPSPPLLRGGVEGFRVVVDRLDVAVPRPDAPVEVAWVERWMHEVAAGFHDVTFIVDEYQLLSTIQRLESRYAIERFAFRAGRGNHALTMLLRKLILHRELAWYPGCGEIAAAHRDDLETELASLLLRESPAGLCRLDHIRDGLHHDDRAFVLGAACLYALEHTAGGDWLSITPPTAGGGFGW
ncbi:MAG: hypothetical protein KY476_10355, partial [Planctomycetes bacterium]|nr:hypothetical protein [Planctomycetota bacterium]